jgi:type IV secretion system protein VirB10
MNADKPERMDAPAGQASAVTALEDEAGIPSVAQARTGRVAWKGVFAVVLLLVSMAAVSVVSINRALSNDKKDADEASKRVSDRPVAASAEMRKLDLTLAAKTAAPASAPAGTYIPAITPTAEDHLAEPIGVRRTGQAPATAAQRMSPEDAPVLLVTSRPQPSAQSSKEAARVTATPRESEDTRADEPLEATRRNLEGYQRQLQGLLDTLTKNSPDANGRAPALPLFGATPAGSPPPSGIASTVAASGGAGLFGGQLQGSATPRVAASMLGDRSLTLPKGTAFTCALKTKVVSAASGFVSCQVQRNVYSDDGRVLLIERGSHMDGEYRIASVRPGTVRIPVLWTRIRTPHGVTVDIDSPGTGPLGESGIDGYVDNRWGERIGAAMLLSLIDDSVKLIIQNQASDRQADTVVLPSTTAGTSKLAEKVLESTINIPPLIYQNQGGIVGIYVARDVDFSTVYELQPVPR